MNKYRYMDQTLLLSFIQTYMRDLYLQSYDTHVHSG